VPGSVVAATLGQLTNVAQVQEAVRLANRLRAEQTAEAKVRMREAEECAQQLRLMTDIPQRKKQLDGAEALLKDAEQAEADYVKLGTLIQQLAGAEATLGAAETAVRDLTGLDGCVAEAQAAVATWTVLETVLEDLTQHQHQADLWAQGQADLLAKADGLEHDRLVKLQAAGVCPTCGASTS
jgi:formate dehydrogenase maturation protein FdhE